MDKRVESLLDDFPEIFEKRPPRIGELDDDWVVIEVPVDQAGQSEERRGIADDLSRISEDDFLSDLDRFDDVENTIGQRYDAEELVSPANIPRRGINIDPRVRSEIINRRRPEAINDIRKRIQDNFPGAPSGLPTNEFAPPPDALAFYLPFHIFPDMWGIYLLDVGVESLAVDLRQIMLDQFGRPVSQRDVRRVSRVFLFHHEAYHCAVESFSVRCELPTRKPVYLTGTNKLYNQGYIPGKPHEETLATAYGLRKVRDEIKLPKRDKKAAVEALKVYIGLCSPEYQKGVEFIDNDRFDEWERTFIEEAMRACSKGTLPTSAWNIGTYMMSPLIQRNRKYSWICKREDFQHSKLSVHYFRRRDVVSCLEKLADAHSESGGKHIHIVRTVNEAGRKSTLRTQLPSGEVHKGTLAGMLRDLDLELNVNSFREKCRKVGRRI